MTSRILKRQTCKRSSLPASKVVVAGRVRWFGAGLIAIIGIAAGLYAPDLYAQDSAKSQPRILMILDSSRSMWGQIDGINKIVSARTVISQTAKRLENKSQFGLIAFGHRQSAGCRDVETLLPMGAHKAGDISKVVNEIRPKGSTPIAAALSEGAKVVGSTKYRASIILIADGLDNCEGDPCAIATELAKGSKGLTIHTIAFDRKEKVALEALSCVAKNTGGTFISATSEKEFQAALDKTVELVLNPTPAAAPVARTTPQSSGTNELAALPSAPKSSEPSPETTSAVIEPGPPAPKAPEKNERVAAAPTMPVPVSFGALLTETGPAIKNGLVWRIFDSKPAPDGHYRLINTFRDASPTAELPPGQYLVNAAYGLSHLTKMVTVRGGTSIKETLVLNAGGLRLGAVLANGGKIAPNSVHYDIFADEADQFGNREKIIGDAKPGLIIRLNAGAYQIASIYGDANAIVHADVTVEPGKLTEATVNHSAGRVTFKLVLKPGGEALADTRWNILTPGGDMVKETVGALPTHILAAGRYSVLATYQGKNYTRDFSLDSGEIKQLEVVIR